MVFASLMRLGMPRLGVAGLGYAIALQFWLTLILYVVCLWKIEDFKPYQIFNWRLKTDNHYLKKIVKIGWPVSLQVGSELIALFVTSILAGWLGEDALAARQVIGQYQFLLIVPMFGVSQAVGVLIGQARGQKQPHLFRMIALVSVAIGAISMALVAVVFWSVPELLASLYLDINAASNRPILHLIVLLFMVASFSLFFDSIRNITAGALRGLYDTQFSFAMSVLMMWCIGLPLSYWLAFPMHMGVVGLSIGFAVGVFLGSIALVWRWYRITGLRNAAHAV